jgi:hypothetical protein
MTLPARLGRSFRGGLCALLALAGVGLAAVPALASQPMKRQAPAEQSPSDTSPAKAAPSQPASCVDHALEAERQYQIPSGLLVSLSLVETGMGGKPQPFVINDDGRAVRAETMEEAARHIRDRAGRLREGLFVGCMQLSVTHHSKNFKPVEHILDPRQNVFYAARYLKRLRAEMGSWTKAVGRYQGGTREQRLAYVCKVNGHLSQLEPRSAALLDSAHCERTDQPTIAPETRRKFRERQVAMLVVND